MLRGAHLHDADGRLLTTQSALHTACQQSHIHSLMAGTFTHSANLNI